MNDREERCVTVPFSRGKKKKKVIKTVGLWLGSLTWGCVMTTFGIVVALVLLLAGCRPYVFHGFLCFEVGEHWGGFEGGPVFVVQKNAPYSLKSHEAGHGLQNLLLGPLMPFLVSIPSAVRYWYRVFRRRKGGGETLPPYDSIWFEGWATGWGMRFFPEEHGIREARRGDK